MKFVVLGAGMMGRAVVYDLARARSAAVDRGGFRLRGRGKWRGNSGEGRRGGIRGRAGYGEIGEASARRDVVVNCTQYNWNLDVMSAALAARVNYMDLGGLYHMTKKQFALDRDFRRIGKLAIAGMGGAPGITNVMARHLPIAGARGFDRGLQRGDGFAALRQPDRIYVFDRDDSRRTDHGAGGISRRAIRREADAFGSGGRAISRADRQGNAAAFDSFGVGNACRKFSQEGRTRGVFQDQLSAGTGGPGAKLDGCGIHEPRTDGRERLRRWRREGCLAGVVAIEARRRRRRAMWKRFAWW